MKLENTLLTRIHFGGFYYSVHSDQLDHFVANLIDAYQDDGSIDEDQLYDFDQWQDVQAIYADAWLDCLNSELEMDLVFKGLDRPTYYNYRTDEIIAEVTKKDILKLFKYIRDNDLRDWLYNHMQKITTSCSGQHSFYDYTELYKKENRSIFVECLINTCLSYIEGKEPLIVENNPLY